MIEKLKTNWKKIVVILFCLIILLIVGVLVLAGISNSSYKSSYNVTDSFERTSPQNVKGSSGFLEGLFSGGGAKSDNGANIEDAAMAEEAGVDLVQKDEKLVYSANLVLETKQLESALEFIYKNIQEHQGIIQQEDQRNYGDTYYVREGYVQQRSSYIFVRVPTDNYDSFIIKMRSSDNVISVTGLNKRVENFTDVYSDLGLQLKSYKTQQDRLFYFLENATSIEDMLSIESKLSELQYKIESIENSMKNIDKDVEYSKVEINLTEVMKYTDVKENPNTFFERLSLYISSSMSAFVITMEGFLEFSIYAIPYIVIIGVVCLIFVKIFKSRNKRKNKTSNIENKQK